MNFSVFTLRSTVFSFLVGIAPLNSWAQSATAVIRPTVTVSDLDRVLPFYTQTLPFELVGIQDVPGMVLRDLFGVKEPGATARIATLKLGSETLDLLDFGKPETGAVIPARLAQQRPMVSARGYCGQRYRQSI